MRFEGFFPFEHGKVYGEVWAGDDGCLGERVENQMGSSRIRDAGCWRFWILRVWVLKK